MNIRTFRQIQRTHDHGSFSAFEYAFTQLESLDNVADVVVYIGSHQYEFLVNDNNRTALYKKCVMRMSKYLIIL